MISVSECSSRLRRLFRFCELGKSPFLLPHKADAFGAVADQIQPFGNGTHNEQRKAGCALVRAEYPESMGRNTQRRAVQNAADRKSTRLNSSHVSISYAVFCLKKK